MYTLNRRPPAPLEPPRLDASQQAVVEHAGGPLLVLAGPGTGKTTTLVESVVARIGRGTAPDAVVVLTFSRRAAADLRSRIAARLARSAVSPVVMTFHGFCYAMIRRFADPAEHDTALRLLTGPEQEFRVREVLSGSPATGRADWPASLDRAFPTRAFAAEVRAVLARARQLGMDPEDLVDSGVAADRPAWAAIGRFFEEYLDVLDAERVLDYAELVHRCRILLADPEVLGKVRAEIGCVFVDEYQDTDPAQIQLLKRLVGRGGDVVVVGDPDQSIYGFRGAEARGILDFPTMFPTGSGDPAPVLALGVTRRYGARLHAVSRRIAGRLAVPTRVPREVFEVFRNPSPAPGLPAGQAEVFTCSSAGAEAEHIAELLREAHLRGGTPWQEMAVLVRSGRRSIPVLGRALIAAGVPVEVAGDEIPLAAEPAVRPLLLALQVAARLHQARGTGGGPRTLSAREVDPVPVTGTPTAGAVTPEEAQLLLTSPLGGMDAMAIRRLGRALREHERLELAGSALPRASTELLAAVFADPAMLAELTDSPDAAAAARLVGLLHRAARAIGRGAVGAAALAPTAATASAAASAASSAAAAPEVPGTRASAAAPVGAEDVLWLLWSATSWPERLRRDAADTGERGRRANRDLDAVCALFEVAARSEEVSGLRGVTGFLAEVEGQQIPADPLREGVLRGSGVRLLTAHRSKGLEWELVVVAGVQEGVWPDLRRRGSLLEPDRLSRDGLTEPAPTAHRIAEERRLFYVACTRARSRLVVTAVDGTEGEGDQPSRFLAELGLPIQPRPGRPRRPLSLPALVAELRCVSVDPEAPPALREQAVLRLADLADRTAPDGSALVPSARPEAWWGLRELSRAETSVIAADQPVVLSGSQLGTLLNCPRNWFLSRRARAETPRSSAASFGSVVHVLAQHAADLDVEPALLAEHLETVWEHLDFDAKWLSGVERIEAEAALERFATWQRGRPHQQVLGTEVDFSVALELDGERVTVTGQADRVERDPDGRIRIVDFKTGRTAPTAAEVVQHDQLGVYQLAVAAGGFASVAGPGARPAGADLVYLRLPEGSSDSAAARPKVFAQPSLDDQPFPLGPPEPVADGVAISPPTWVHARLAEAARIVRSERFDARVGPGCRYCPFRSSCPAQPAGRQVVP